MENAKVSSRPTEWSVAAFTRLVGVLFLLSALGGGFGEFYVPTHIIVAGDAAATASNVITHAWFFRLGFAAYLVEATCDIALAWAFYVLLKPVQKNLALLAAFFGLVATATFAGAELFYFAPAFILGGAGYLNTFSPDPLKSLAMLSFKFYGYGGFLFTLFYGFGWIIRGYLIFRSGYLPRTLGVLLAIAGLGFVVHNFVMVLAPAYASDFLLTPMFLGGVAMMLWFFVKGVNVERWNERVALSR
jgi:hypothetical protein